MCVYILCVHVYVSAGTCVSCRLLEVRGQPWVLLLHFENGLSALQCGPVGSRESSSPHLLGEQKDRSQVPELEAYALPAEPFPQPSPSDS